MKSRAFAPAGAKPSVTGALRRRGRMHEIPTTLQLLHVISVSTQLRACVCRNVVRTQRFTGSSRNGVF